MSAFVEAIVTMFPREAGGRSAVVAPREGTYRPFVRIDDGLLLRLRFIEGPPAVAPGETARVVAELEDGLCDDLLHGVELDLYEGAASRVGFLTIARFLAAEALP